MPARRRLSWAPIAVDDLEGILDYLAVEAGGDRAAEIGSRILARIATLTRFPERGRVVPELKRIGLRDFRELIVGPYRIFFRIDASIVGIVGILDGGRDVEEVLASRGIRG